MLDGNKTLFAPPWGQTCVLFSLCQMGHFGSRNGSRFGLDWVEERSIAWLEWVRKGILHVSPWENRLNQVRISLDSPRLRNLPSDSISQYLSISKAQTHTIFTKSYINIRLPWLIDRGYGSFNQSIKEALCSPIATTNREHPLRSPLKCPSDTHRYSTIVPVTPLLKARTPLPLDPTSVYK